MDNFGFNWNYIIDLQYTIQFEILREKYLIPQATYN